MNSPGNRLSKRESLRDLGEVSRESPRIELSFLDLEYEHHRNRLEKAHEQPPPLRRFRPKMGEKEREENEVFDAYMRWRSITEALEQLLLARSSLEPREILR